MSDPGGHLGHRLFELLALLLHARFIDLFFIVLGVIGLCISAYFIMDQPSRTQARVAREHQAVLREQRIQAVQEERRRQQALREQQQRAEQERLKQEAEARHKLEQTGVRGVNLSSAPPELPRSVGVSLEIRSDPEDAEVFVDWALKGHTPVRLEGIKISGFLLVAKEGYRPWFQQVHYADSAALSFILPFEETRAKTHLLLLIAEGSPAEAFSSLSARLVEAGFVVVGAAETTEFQQTASHAGDLSHHGFRAWTRERFNTGLLLTARVRQSSRELGEQDVGYTGIREAVAGVVRADVDVELEARDLHAGHHLTTVSSKGSAITLHRSLSLQKALDQATADIAKKLRVWIQG